MIELGKLAISPKLFPTLIIIGMFSASIGYFAVKDLKRGFYWLSWSMLNLTVTL